MRIVMRLDEPTLFPFHDADVRRAVLPKLGPSSMAIVDTLYQTDSGEMSDTELAAATGLAAPSAARTFKRLEMFGLATELDDGWHLRPGVPASLFARWTGQLRGRGPMPVCWEQAVARAEASAAATLAHRTTSPALAF